MREVPARAWKPMFLGALALFLLLMAGWEHYWRAFGAVPSYANSDGEWAQQRRRLDDGEGGKTVILGSSRMLFDDNLDVWEHTVGERPIQLALEGTSPVPVLEDLAADPEVTGRVVVGVAPELFFSGRAMRRAALDLAHKQGPSQRVGNWLSRHLVEPYFAYYDSDFALATVINRQAWPHRPGKVEHARVRKLMIQPAADRNSEMWDKVATDPAYRALARAIWAEKFDEAPPGMASPEDAQKAFDKEIDRAAAAVAKLRARGARVVFVRAPSADAYYQYEQRFFPRDKTWDRLLAKTGAPGIHFEDHAELQGYELPEWSHMTAAEAKRFTAQLAPLVMVKFRELESAPRAAPNP